MNQRSNLIIHKTLKIHNRYMCGDDRITNEVNFNNYKIIPQDTRKTNRKEIFCHSHFLLE
jgi:hypothetical protein